MILNFTLRTKKKKNASVATSVIIWTFFFTFLNIVSSLVFHSSHCLWWWDVDWCCWNLFFGFIFLSLTSLSYYFSLLFFFWLSRLVLHEMMRRREEKNTQKNPLTFGKMILQITFSLFFYNFMTTLKLKCVHDTVLIFFWIIFTIFFHFFFFFFYLFLTHKKKIFLIYFFSTKWRDLRWKKKRNFMWWSRYSDSETCLTLWKFTKMKRKTLLCCTVRKVTYTFSCVCWDFSCSFLVLFRLYTLVMLSPKWLNSLLSVALILIQFIFFHFFSF